MSTQLIAYRHPPIHNPDGLCYGRYDIALAEGWREAMGQLTPYKPITTRLFVSPASRAKHMAAWLWPDSFVCVTEALAEMDFGAWEGRPWSDIPEAEVSHWGDDLMRHSPPGGESADEMQQRLLGFVQTMQDFEQVEVITHHGVLKLLLGIARSLPLAEALRIQVPFGGRVVLRVTEDGLEEGES